MYDFGILNGHVYDEGKLVKKNVFINKDHIVAFHKEEHPCKDYYDASGLWILPGLIDPHVHMELGDNLKSVDDFTSGSIAAAHGGITTMIDFLDPISRGDELRKALSSRYQLAKKSMIDYSFHVALKNPVGEIENIVDAMKEYGLNSIKIFTTYSDTGRRTYEKEINRLLEMSEQEGFTLLVHTEKDDLIKIDSSMEVKDLPICRPKEAEQVQAIELMKKVESIGGKLYMVHLSHGETLEALREENEGILGEKFFVETCPHYLYFDESYYNNKDGYLYAMAPPLRDKASITKLKDQFQWINTIGTDHCPFNSDDKKDKKLSDIPLGVGGVEHSFNLMYNLIGLDAVKKMSETPAKIFGLYPKKGCLKPGSNADIMVFDPNAVHKITENNSNCDYNLYEGIEVKGEIVSTICKGQFVIREGELVIGSVGHYCPMTKMIAKH